MIDSSQKLAQLALGKSRAQSYGLVCAGSDVGAQFYSVLAACNLVVETLDDMSKLVQSVTLKTRLVVLEIRTDRDESAISVNALNV